MAWEQFPKLPTRKIVVFFENRDFGIFLGPRGPLSPFGRGNVSRVVHPFFYFLPSVRQPQNFPGDSVACGTLKNLAESKEYFLATLPPPLLPLVSCHLLSPSPPPAPHGYQGLIDPPPPCIPGGYTYSPIRIQLGTVHRISCIAHIQQLVTRLTQVVINFTQNEYNRVPYVGYRLLSHI
jgi:hypothetical protein